MLPEDTDSEYFNDDEDHGALLTVEEHTAMHMRIFRSAFSRFRTIAIGGLPAKCILSHPTASNVISDYLHPAVYRNVSGIGGMDELAAILGVDNWRMRSVAALQCPAILLCYRRFRALPDAAMESQVEASFLALIYRLSTALSVVLDGKGSRKFGVGGLLVEPNCAIRGVTDSIFADAIDGHSILATECKTEVTFPMGAVWYRKSRAAQTLGTLYSCRCPTLLYTQRQFKLFVLNEAGNQILTYTPRYGVQATEDASFLECLCICLLQCTHVDEMEAIDQAAAILSPDPVSARKLATPPTSERRAGKICFTGYSDSSSDGGVDTACSMSHSSKLAERLGYPVRLDCSGAILESRDVWLVDDDEIDPDGDLYCIEGKCRDCCI
jgi:hypothetical protein